MLPVFSGGHSAYQGFVVTNLNKYYPNPDALARSAWDIINHFYNLSFTDHLLHDKNLNAFRFWKILIYHSSIFQHGWHSHSGFRAIIV